MFASKASGALFDLGLDVRRLPDEPRKKFFIEAHALHTATKGKFEPEYAKVTLSLALQAFVLCRLAHGAQPLEGGISTNLLE